METLEEFDAMLEAEENNKPVRKSTTAIDALVINQEIAARLVSGQPVEELAEELNVTPATIYRRINKAPMQDLIHIEARRVLRHMSQRDLAKEKYLGLATALGVMVDKERYLRDVESGVSNKVSQTQIDQINILLFGRGVEKESVKASSDIEELAKRAITEIPAEIEQEGSGYSSSDSSSDNPIGKL
jgi:hypothetical protein